MTHPINYDARTVGEPYIRARHVSIEHPPLGSTTEQPRALIRQRWAVKLADGSVAELGPAPDIERTLNLTDQTPMPLVDNDSGEPLPLAVREQMAGAIMAGVVTEGIVMLCVLASVRAKQPPAEV
jgi:hypothetical protein